MLLQRAISPPNNLSAAIAACRRLLSSANGGSSLDQQRLSGQTMNSNLQVALRDSTNRAAPNTV
jgi:hypothetical protein